MKEFGRQRLLTFDRDPSSRTPTVEVAHEALLTDWNRLKGWIDEARDDLLTRRRLESSTNEWINADCDGSFLIGGGRLEDTEVWAADSGFALTHDERRFLSESRAKVDRDASDRGPRRRRREPIGALIVGLVATSRAGRPCASPAQPSRRRAAPSPRPAASAPKHNWSTTTTRRCSSRWKGGTWTTRPRHGRTCSRRSNAAPRRLLSSGTTSKRFSISDSRLTARPWSRADSPAMYRVRPQIARAPKVRDRSPGRHSQCGQPGWQPSRDCRQRRERRCRAEVEVDIMDTANSSRSAARRCCLRRGSADTPRGQPGRQICRRRDGQSVHRSRSWPLRWRSSGT